jgi:hypothetical protein
VNFCCRIEIEQLIVGPSESFFSNVAGTLMVPSRLEEPVIVKALQKMQGQSV